MIYVPPVSGSIEQKLHNFIKTFHQGCKRTANVINIWTLGSGSEGKGGLCACTSVSVGRCHNSLISISINSACKHHTAVCGCCTHSVELDLYKHPPLILCLPPSVVAGMNFCQNWDLTTYIQNLSCCCASQAAGTASLLTHFSQFPPDCCFVFSSTLF